MLYRELVKNSNVADQTVFVIGHRNPDFDSVASAVSYAYLLRQLGIHAEAAIGSEVNNETACGLKLFHLKAPQIISNAQGKQFVLVDHSSYSQAIDGMKQARIVGIIDHHGIGDVVCNEPVNVRSGAVGATVTLIWLSYMECGIEIEQEMAGLMLAGLLSDTRNMKRNVTAADEAAYHALKDLAKIEDIDLLYQTMAEAAASYGEQTDREIYYSDCKEYVWGGKRISIADVNALNEEKVIVLAEKMYAVMKKEHEITGVDLSFCIINNQGNNESENRMYMLAYGKDAVAILDRAFHTYDGNRYFIFKEKLSRKTEIVPVLSEIIAKENE